MDDFLPKLDCADCNVSGEFEPYRLDINFRTVDKIEPGVVPMSEIISFVCSRFDLRCWYRSWGSRYQNDGSSIISIVKTGIERLASRFGALVSLRGGVDREVYIDFTKLSGLVMLDLGAGSVGYHMEGSRQYEPWLVRALRPFIEIWGVDRDAPKEDGMVSGDFRDANFLSQFADGKVDIVSTSNAFDGNPCPWLGDLALARKNIGRELIRVTHPGSVIDIEGFYIRKKLVADVASHVVEPFSDAA